MSEEIRMKVSDLTKGDSGNGRGIVRLNRKIMNKLQIKEGDIIQVNDKTAAVAFLGYPSDIDTNLARMDGLVRKNSGAHIGDFVTLKKAEVKPAKLIKLAPVDERIVLRASPDIIRNIMYMRPVRKGDFIIPKSVFKKNGEEQDEPDYEDTNPMQEAVQHMVKNMFPGMSPNIRIIGNMPGMFPNEANIGGEHWLTVVDSQPEGIVTITDDTKIEVLKEAVKNITSVTYEDVGGLKEIVPKVREMIELPLTRPEIFEKLGVEPPRGVLLYGPPGTGKTLLAKAVANESGAHFISIAGPEFMSSLYGQSEENLRQKFKEAEEHAPSIIFIDEVDTIAPSREETRGEVEKRVVSTLLTQMDGLKQRGKVIVIAATNRPNDLDPALRRTGRFDRELEIPVPTKQGRKEILQIHMRNMPLKKDVDIDHLAEITYGFVGADLSGLTKEAAMCSLRRVIPDLSELKDEDPIPEEIKKKIEVTKDDFDYAMRVVQPSGMREVMVEMPKTTWADVGGLTEARESLIEAVDWPLNHEKSFERLGIKPPKGILLYGPPGCGKTHIVKALAHESGVNFVSIKAGELMSKWVGESEKHVRDVFKRAKQVAPTIIFFDEIDALAPRRGMHIGSDVSEKVVSQLLTEMSGLEELKQVVVVAATNRPDIIDPALLRPGRFDRLIFIGPPDEKAREQIFEVHTKNMPMKKINPKELAKKTDGYSGADIEAVVREAALTAMRESLDAKEVSPEHFDSALKKIKASISPNLKKKYDKIVEEVKKNEPDESSRYIG